MKKYVLPIISSTIIVVLAVGCGWLYMNYRDYRNCQEHLSDALANVDQQAQEISDLQDVVTEKDDYIQGQAEYITELNAQLDTLAGFAESKASDSGDSDSESYQEKYPELYAQAEYDKRTSEDNRKKTVYLTFDDGPSNLTPQVLDLLDEYDAKATFFVVYNEENTKYLSEIVERGHTLALHSYSHNYDKIYASVDAFLTDLEKVYNWVYEETGQRPALFRFPGGSTNGTKAITNEIIKEMQRRGFIYYDWNVSSGDGSMLTTTENIIENICSNVGTKDFPVVLMHDGAGKTATLAALPDVLEFLHSNGYSFDALDETMTPVQYKRSK